MIGKSEHWYYVWEKELPQFYYIFFATSPKHAKGLYLARIGFDVDSPYRPSLGVRRATAREIDDYKHMLEVIIS